MIAGREVALAVVLSTVAGYLDAVGYVVLGGFFVSFMSGNTTELATRLGASAWSIAGFGGTLIGAFFAGTVLGAVLARLRDGRTTVLTATTVLVAATSLAVMFTDSKLPIMLGLPLAMGVVNATFLTAGEASIGLTYMTGALVKAGQRLVDAFHGGPRMLWARHLSLWASLLTGGVIGTVVLHQTSLAAALWSIAVVLAIITTVVAVDRRRRGVYGTVRQRTEIHVLGPLA